ISGERSAVCCSANPVLHFKRQARLLPPLGKSVESLSQQTRNVHLGYPESPGDLGLGKSFSESSPLRSGRDRARLLHSVLPTRLDPKYAGSTMGAWAD